MAQSELDAALHLVRAQQKDPSQQCAEEMLRQRDKNKRGLDSLEASAEEGLWFNGTQHTLADIATACTLGY
ncbi:glutathione binding-like protein, partial [Erwinia amylovora]|uniref:glutathione binding-like protein n=1 Tax=Erwinia amylovora TaxID=552 RepID=UPI0020BF41DC